MLARSLSELQTWSVRAAFELQDAMPPLLLQGELPPLQTASVPDGLPRPNTRAHPFLYPSALQRAFWSRVYREIPGSTPDLHVSCSGSRQYGRPQSDDW